MSKIEVCQRLGDYQNVVQSNEFGVATTVRISRYHAQIAGDPKKWGVGCTIDEAIGSLIRSFPEEFQIEICELEPQNR